MHFYPPSGLVLPPRTKVTDMDFLTSLTAHHVWLVGQLIDRAETLSDEQLDAPIEISVAGIDENPTIRSLLSRLVGQLDMWNHARADQDYDFARERGETLDSMRARLEIAGSAFQAHVQSVVEEECTGNGALACLVEGYRADAAVIPEPVPGVLTCQVGVMWVSLEVLGKPVHAMRVSEAVSLGTAILAGTATGVYPSAREAALELSKVERTYRPDAKRAKAYRERFARYRELYPTLRDWLHKI